MTFERKLARVPWKLSQFFFFQNKLSRLENVLFLQVSFASHFRKRLSKATFERKLSSVSVPLDSVNQHARCLGQKSFSSKLLCSHTYPTDSSTWTTKLVGNDVIQMCHALQPCVVLVWVYLQYSAFVFSALTLLVGRQEGHLACKNWVIDR